MRRLLALFLLLAVLPISACSSAAEPHIIVATKAGTPAVGAKFFLSGEFIGTTDDAGRLPVAGLEDGHYYGEAESTSGRREGSGFWVNRGRGKFVVDDVFVALQLPTQTGSTVKPYTERWLELPSALQSVRNTRVTVQYDSSVPASTADYVNELVTDLEPVIRGFVGEPIQNGSFTLKLDQGQHVGFQNEKTVLLVDKLPDISSGQDAQWDQWFLINYIHKYLQGRSIPIPGSRYTENVSQTVSDLVSIYLTQRNIRNLDCPLVYSIDYYLQAWQPIESLGASILLNQGGTEQPGYGFDPMDFLWDSKSYDRMNAFDIQYAKSVWMKLLQARLEESGQLDFFLYLQEGLNSVHPSNPSQFYGILDSIVKDVDGRKASTWLRDTSAMRGKIDEPLAARIWPVRGHFFNVQGSNNPNVLYPLLVSRSPGRVLEDTVKVQVIDSRGTAILEEDVQTGFDVQGIPHSVEVPDNLAPGKYTAVLTGTIDGKAITDKESFFIAHPGFEQYCIEPPVVKTGRQASISVSYDDSIPAPVQQYLEELRQLVDPVIRSFVGAPIANQKLIIKHDPSGLAGMNGNMTVLNFKVLPDISKGPDESADAFFFIEYYHMFHRGSDIPVVEARYTENISQSMKIVIGHYLGQNGIRDIGGGLHPIHYYLKLQPILDQLGPGILTNQGLENGNPGISPVPVRCHWADAEFEQDMNTFTLEYPPTVWLTLADAAYRYSGKYDFFFRLQETLATNPPQSSKQFYQLISTLVPARFDGLSAGEWLRRTASFSSLPDGDVFVAVLPMQGNRWDMLGVDNPHGIWPFVVERKGAAKLLPVTTTVQVLDAAGDVILSEDVEVGFNEYGEVNGLAIPDGALEPGTYTANMTVRIDGKTYTVSRPFTVSR